MCRLACFPPNFPRREALKVMAHMYLGNEDGTGSVYVKNGKFVVNKWRYSFETVVKGRYPLFDHMPYPGWTVAHVRAASHGSIRKRNTHPFLLGEWSMAHNGVFLEHKIVKAALSPHYQFSSQTDSEVALALWDAAGASKFIKAMDSGVYMFLKKDGSLYTVVCNGGDLNIKRTRYGTLMASELDKDTYRNTKAVLEGWLKFDKKGKAKKSSYEEDKPFEWSKRDYYKSHDSYFKSRDYNYEYSDSYKRHNKDSMGMEEEEYLDKMFPGI